MALQLRHADVVLGHERLALLALGLEVVAQLALLDLVDLLELLELLRVLLLGLLDRLEDLGVVLELELQVLDLLRELARVGLKLGVLGVGLLERLLELVQVGLHLRLLVLELVQALERRLERLLLGHQLRRQLVALLLELRLERLEGLALLLLLLERLLELGDAVLELLLGLLLAVDAQQRLDLAVELPPRPVVQVDEDLGVLLDDEDGVRLAVRAAVRAAGEVAAGDGLEARQELANLVVAALLERGDHARLEEDLAETHAVLLLLDVERRDELLRRDLRVHKALGDRARGEDLVPLLELGEGDARREAHAHDTDALEHTVAAQLLEHQRRVDDAGLLLLVGDDAPHKMRVRLVEGGEQVGQLLAVALADGDEVVGLAAALRDLVDVGRVLKQLGDELVGRLAEEPRDVVVDRVLVLVEPVVGVVLDLARVVRDHKHVWVEAELAVLRALALVLRV
eukprot:Unigene1265_Nuclearia_a/m.4022 Unigene1265_Nuclearia_a/g.4022  ORF Unigene1265_Nuclearia_a/g.4022 Unigene1265_Nuclearia_a/m.4022 type:complete len:457 (+) Unigene1265_Nuclearia_a:826-2196(+)